MDKTLLNEAIKNYDNERAQGLPQHDLTKAKINEQTVFLIKRGWTFWYPPQNTDSDQEMSMMLEPKRMIGHHYIAAYKMVTEPTLFDCW